MASEHVFVRKQLRTAHTDEKKYLQPEHEDESLQTAQQTVLQYCRTEIESIATHISLPLKRFDPVPQNSGLICPLALSSNACLSRANKQARRRSIQTSKSN